MISALEILKSRAAETEDALKDYFSAKDPDIFPLYEAMEYSTLGGGKRLRAALVLEFCALFGGDIKSALPYACAVEMIHAFSLIHDDLPCMDNADTRRGKPSCHKVYGEANALLAGDALALLPFEITADNPCLSPEKNAEAVICLARAAGPAGMTGGQTIDLAAEKNAVSYEKLIKLHSLKTGALIRAAARLGCIAAGADEENTKKADIYAANIGLAFQITDDILDESGDEALLGKPKGGDSKNEKTTFLSFMPAKEAAKKALEITEEAKKAISDLPGSQRLMALADWLPARNV